MYATPVPIDPQRLQDCLGTLMEVRSLPADDPDYLAIEQAAAYLRKSAKRKRRRARKAQARQHDGAIVRTAAIISGGEVVHSQESLQNQRSCYACKQPYYKVHHYYHSMCLECGDLCLGKREQHADLRGRRALVTGGRTKIGYAIALKLLRDGAEVHISTRFPNNAARRYLAEADHTDWRDRLHIVGSDFRRMPEFLAQVQCWKEGPPFDILINNAAQTVWHPPAYYRGLWAEEKRAFCGPEWIDSPATAPQLEAPAVDGLADELFPIDRQDAFGNPLDLRRENSWVQHVGQINPVEMIEVQVVNNIAPFILCNELLENMQRSSFANRFIVNVAAVEGQFNRDKLSRHPHTNMAKAALNMLTRTSSADCAQHNVHMVSVDPGWMSHEGPHENVAEFQTPLEAIDSAARIYDPIVSGIDGTPLSGVLLKDFREVPW